MIHPMHFEVKSLSDDGAIVGIASTYDVDQGGDQVVPGAFAKSIASKPDGVPMLWSHQPDQPIGKWTNLTENANGLQVAGNLIMGVSKARETFDLLKAKAVNGLSIGYRTVEADYNQATGVRLLKQLDLMEISVVTFPMNTGAKVLTVKADEITTEREFERFLRDAGFSRDRARVLTKGFVPAPKHQRDADEQVASELLRTIRAHTLNLSGDHQ
jgi:HK97 family phage prohead protease